MTDPRKTYVCTKCNSKLTDLQAKFGECHKCIQDKFEKRKIWELRDLVWGMDVPHPGCPEYVELHEKIQRILKFIDTELLEVKE